jgi:methylmalonyl-CoA mutase C-terminal domain/subunit
MSRGRVIVAKVGLDGHTTGAAVVALGLRDAGFDVINLGTRVRPEQAVAAALQEDVDVIGLSILSGAHVHLTRRVCELAREKGLDAAIVVGGTIPESDAAEMRAFGTAAVFGPGTSMPTIVDTIERLVAERRGARVIDRRPRQGA